MKQNQKGFTLIEVLLLVIALTLIAFTGWYVWNSQDKAEPASNAIKSSVKNVKKSTDPTASWKEFSSATGKYSLRYPTSWVTAPNQDLCEGGILLLGPTLETVGRCNSDGGGQVAFYSSDEASGSTGLASDDYRDFKTEPVTIEGSKGERQSGTVNKDAEGIGPSAGTKEILYIVEANSRIYRAYYSQQPGFPDVAKDFDLIVTKTLKFTQ